MTLELNMWGESMPTTYANSSKDIMEYHKIGRENISGIDQEWNYAAIQNEHTWRLAIKGYIELFLLQFDHRRPAKTQLLPRKHREIHFVAKVQVTPCEVDVPSLDAKGIKRVQDLMGALLLCGQEVDKKVLVDLNTIGNP